MPQKEDTPITIDLKTQRSTYGSANMGSNTATNTLNGQPGSSGNNNPNGSNFNLRKSSIFCLHGQHKIEVRDHCHRQRSEGVDVTARRKLIIASVICVVFMTCEIIGGILSNSLAIATDAAHLLTDLAGFLISLFAIWLAGRPSTQRMSFGWYRAEVIGALASVVTIWFITAILVWLAVERVINQDFEVDAKIMLITSGLAILVNVIMGLQLQHGHMLGHGHSHGGGGSGGGGGANNKKWKKSKKSTEPNALGLTFVPSKTDLSQQKSNIISNSSLTTTVPTPTPTAAPAPNSNNAVGLTLLQSKVDLSQQTSNLVSNSSQTSSTSPTPPTERLENGVDAQQPLANGPPTKFSYQNSHNIHDLDNASLKHGQAAAADHHGHAHGHGHGLGSGPGPNQMNINVRAAFIHVLGDIIQSVGVFVAALCIYFKPEWALVDPICTFVFSVIVLFTTFAIMKEALLVLMEGTPNFLHYAEILSIFQQIEGVERVHNLRIWALSLNKVAISVHLAIAEGTDPKKILEEATTAVHMRYNFFETTIQIENFTPDMEDCQQCSIPAR